jgi:hypothetical protein
MLKGISIVLLIILGKSFIHTQAHQQKNHFKKKVMIGTEEIEIIDFYKIACEEHYFLFLF